MGRANLLLSLCMPAALLGAVGPAAAQGQPDKPPAGKPAPKKPDLELFDEVYRLFRDQFYDRGLHGVDWEAAYKKHRPRAEQARTPEELHDAMSAMIAELKASHACVIEGDVYRDHVEAESHGKPVPEYGMRVVHLPEGWFVSEVVHGSAALAAGVRRGDRVISVDGVPVESAPLRPAPWDSGLGIPREYYLPTPKVAGQAVRLDLERFPRPKGLYTVEVKAANWNLLEASLASRRVIERQGVKIGYLRLYHLLSDDMVELLLEFLVKDLRDAQAVVVDLRGMGGLPRAVEKIADLMDPNRLGCPVWGRPAVALIDRGTRSAKEMVAWEWRTRGVGPLVGTRSAGAVIGASFKQLDDGACLLFPSMDMRSSTGGVVLEGRGMEPDFPVDNAVPWAQGRDPVLEKGLEVAEDLARALARRGKKHGWH